MKTLIEASDKFLRMEFEGDYLLNYELNEAIESILTKNRIGETNETLFMFTLAEQYPIVYHMMVLYFKGNVADVYRVCQRLYWSVVDICQGYVNDDRVNLFSFNVIPQTDNYILSENFLSSLRFVTSHFEQMVYADVARTFGNDYEKTGIRCNFEEFLICLIDDTFETETFSWIILRTENDLIRMRQIEMDMYRSYVRNCEQKAVSMPARELAQVAAH